MKTQEKNKYKSKKRTKSRKIWNGLPAFTRKHEPENSLYYDFFLSISGHLTGFVMIWGLTLLLAFWGVNNAIFPKPQPKIPDIEFVLNNKTKYKKARYNSSLTGASKKSENQTQKNVESLTNESKSKNHNKKAKATEDIADDFSMPIPKIKSASSVSDRLNRRASSSSYEPFSSSAETSASANGSNSKSSTSGSGSGYGKEATRKIVSAYDISPYVNELKRTIRWNWKQPKNDENKNVELFLRIAKDGRIIILNVKKTSEIAAVDNAALNAVRRSEPLSPLPSKYNKSYLDVVFTFNSRVSSVSSRY